MDSTLRNLRIQTVRAQLSALEIEYIALASRLDGGSRPNAEQAAIALQWNEVMQESVELQSKLDQLMADTHILVH